MMNEAYNDGPDIIEQCFCCRLGDDDVYRCAADGCTVYLHKHCGARCEACGNPVCAEHIEPHEDHELCPACLQDVRRIAQEDSGVLAA
jgi:hypothetical protein